MLVCHESTLPPMCWHQMKRRKIWRFEFHELQRCFGKDLQTDDIKMWIFVFQEHYFQAAETKVRTKTETVRTDKIQMTELVQALAKVNQLVAQSYTNIKDFVRHPGIQTNSVNLFNKSLFVVTTRIFPLSKQRHSFFSWMDPAGRSKKKHSNVLHCCDCCLGGWRQCEKPVW